MTEQFCPVPFVDLHAQYLALKEEMDPAIQSVIDETAFIGGSQIRTFESSFAAAVGTPHCLALANGTDAIYIALKQLGIGAGDEVLVPALTWISTSETVSQTGATPVFVDVDPDYFTMDPVHAITLLGPKTRAMIPVHLYGQAADLDALMLVCADGGIHMIEDCAQAHLTQYAGRTVGTFGVAGTFSFYPGKNLGAYGDAGALITGDSALAERMRMYANHGQRKKHDHVMEGINSRLDTIHAAVLNVKLPHLGSWNDSRREHAARYAQRLSGIDGLRLPMVRPDTKHTFHLYVVRTDRRDQLRAYLEAAEISVAVHYPNALPDVPAYASMRGRSECPVASGLAGEILSLPMYPEMPEDLQDYVIDRIRSFFNA